MTLQTLEVTESVGEPKYPDKNNLVKKNKQKQLKEGDEAKLNPCIFLISYSGPSELVVTLSTEAWSPFLNVTLYFVATDCQCI